MVSLSTAAATAMAAAVKAGLDGGLLKIFSGPVPANAEAAIDGASVVLAVITEDGDGSTGLTFDVPTTGTLSKAAAETWTCLGADVVSGTATFWRFCEDGDAGTALSTTALRIQGLVGTNPFEAELLLGSTTLTNGVDLPIDAFAYNVPEA